VIPSSRYAHSFVPFQGRAYLHGGKALADGALLSDTWCYDFASGHWRELQTTGIPPLPRAAHVAMVLPPTARRAACLVVALGCRTNDLRAMHQTHVFALGLDTLHWVRLDGTPGIHVRETPNLIGRDGCYFGFGGRGHSGTCLRDTIRLDLSPLDHNCPPGLEPVAGPTPLAVLGMAGPPTAVLGGDIEEDEDAVTIISEPRPRKVARVSTALTCLPTAGTAGNDVPLPVAAPVDALASIVPLVRDPDALAELSQSFLAKYAPSPTSSSTDESPPPEEGAASNDGDASDDDDLLSTVDSAFA